MISSQNFYNMRHRCLTEMKLFEDPDFPPSDKFLMRKEEKPVVWMRPREICHNPKFVIDGFSRFDVKQGVLGNCWFLAALETMTLNPKLFHKVVYDDNDWERDKQYAGIFHFRFWKYGKWVEVVIDDRLPTIDGKLIYLKAPQDEFWCALIEKAYAKFYGSYSAIDGGSATEAMIDFSGGVIERYNLKPLPPKLFRIIVKAKERGSMITSSIFEDSEQTRLKGLVGQHAYSITGAEEVKNKEDKVIQLLRIKNPWGNHVEWNGPFSDKSSEWKSIPSKVLKDLRRKIHDDGEFYMPYEEFTRNFDRVELCHICPDALNLQDCSKKWNESILDDFWIAGEGDSPQVIVKLDDPDEMDEEEFCTLIVSLMQKHRRNMNAENVGIKFDVYKLNSHDFNLDFLEKDFFMREKPDGSHAMEPYREIVSRFKFLPGHYAIIPRIEMAMDGEFLLRIITEAADRKQNAIVKINRRDSPYRRHRLESTVTLLDVCDIHSSFKPHIIERERRKSHPTRILLLVIVLLVICYIAYEMAF